MFIIGLVKIGKTTLIYTNLFYFSSVVKQEIVCLYKSRSNPFLEQPVLSN